MADEGKADEGKADEAKADEGGGSSALWRLSSIGFELMAAIVGMGLLGYWIDRHYGTAPRALLICIGIGMVGGLYNTIRSALKASRNSDKDTADGDET